MDTNNAKSEIKLLISDLLQNGITEINKEKIIKYLCNPNLENVEYLIYTLLYLKETTSIIELLSQSFYINKLLSFLFVKENNNCEIKKIVENYNDDNNGIYYKTADKYEPMTEEKALTIQFDPNSNLSIPKEGYYNKIYEKFYFTDEDGIKKHCSREFKIDHTGKVVAYYGETITEVNNDKQSYYAGGLGDTLFELSEDDLQLDK